ncbi:Flagellar hook-associated protein 1 [Planococcus massiliensis]|uniref:Flagellar hook-associated protein 1 n=1 Tax=Planococcus massiliensis TaxID=1499687 RepID=A0A098ERB9_9BACL|nr:flagellar hook-associated protein FlgK [Planococcus massiliensis]CEG24345.1 Flagellar hook-associated protein 1 [Planococcus massiliensis]
MVSTFHGLELGKRGLNVAQTNITTTGHNIANANTEGYSRQKVNSSSTPSLDIWTNGQTSQLGTGAQVDSIIRVRDRFLDAQHRDQSSTLGEWKVRQETLGRLEVAINEPSTTGLNAAMDELNAAWQNVQNNPSDASAQAVLKERGEAFVETAQAMNKSMGNITADLESQQTAALEEAGSLMKQIGELNDSIKKNGSLSNDLQDKRDFLIGKLSEIVPVTVKDLKDGTAEVELPKDIFQVDAETGALTILKDEVTDKELKVPGGKLAGIQKSLETVKEYQTDLNSTVKKFAEGNGDLFASSAAADFISGLALNKNADLSIAPTANLGEAQKDFRALVSKLGAQSQTAMNTVANHESALLATDNRRQSIVGVSIDEEMANLIMFQHAYSAAARFITTTDEMLDTIINRMAN